MSSILYCELALSGNVSVCLHSKICKYQQTG